MNNTEKTRLSEKAFLGLSIGFLISILALLMWGMNFPKYSRTYGYLSSKSIPYFIAGIGGTILLIACVLRIFKFRSIVVKLFLVASGIWILDFAVHISRDDFHFWWLVYGLAVLLPAWLVTSPDVPGSKPAGQSLISLIVVGGIFSIGNLIFAITSLNDKDVLNPIRWGIQAAVFIVATVLLGAKRNIAGIRLLAIGGGISFLLDVLIFAVGYWPITSGAGIIPIVLAIITIKKTKKTSINPLS